MSAASDQFKAALRHERTWYLIAFYEAEAELANAAPGSHALRLVRERVKALEADPLAQEGAR